MERFTIQGITEAWYRDRIYVLAGRVFHEFMAGVAELAKINVAELLSSSNTQAASL